MANRQSTSNRRARKKRVQKSLAEKGASPPSLGTERDDVKGASTLYTMIQAIGHERGRLCDAQSVLACLYSALLNARRLRVPNEADYAGAAGIAMSILKDSVERLDAICISSVKSNTSGLYSSRVRRHASA